MELTLFCDPTIRIPWSSKGTNRKHQIGFGAVFKFNIWSEDHTILLTVKLKIFEKLFFGIIENQLITHHLEVLE